MSRNLETLKAIQNFQQIANGEAQLPFSGNGFDATNLQDAIQELKTTTYTQDAVDGITDDIITQFETLAGV